MIGMDVFVPVLLAVGVSVCVVVVVGWLVGKL